jgi:hypothetical protein
MTRVHTRVVWQWRDGVLVELPEEGESYEYEGPVALCGAGTPVSRITHYRGRSDTGTVDGTPTWIAAEDTSFSVTPGTAFRIRIGAENTGTASDTITQPDTTSGIQRCGHNNLAFTGLVNVINGADAGSSADAANVTTQRLTSGTGTFATGSGGYDESESLSCAVANGAFTEVEFGVVLTGGASTAGVGGGETWTFQVGGLTNAAANTPTFTTADTNGSDFQHGNQLGGAGQAVANSANISMTTAAAARASNLVVVAVTCDNNGTTDADHSEVTGVTFDGTAMTKAVEFTNGEALAQAGVTVSVWWLQIGGSDVSAGATVTATFATNTTNGDANAIVAREFVVASGKTVSVEAVNSAATDAAITPASIDATTANIECLRVAAHAVESGPAANDQADDIRASNSTWSLWWTSGALVRASALAIGNTAVAIQVEAKISTGTGAASAPSNVLGAARDWASAYVAFRADTGTDFEDGAGSANVDVVSTATGESTSAQPGSANADFAATATGASIADAAGAAVIDFAASAGGDGQTSLDGAANVDFSSAATGAPLFNGAGSANVDFSSAAVGESTSAQPGSANVDFSSAGIGESTNAQAGDANVDFSAAATGAPLADAAGSANVDFDAAGQSPQDGGDAAGDANVDFAATAAGESTADASSSVNVDFASAAVGAPLADADGSANVDFASAAVGISTADADGSANVDFAASAAGDGETSLEGAANVDFSTATVGAPLADASGAAVVDFASAAVGESFTDAVGAANIDFAMDGVIQAGDAAGDANIDFAADAAGDALGEGVGEAVIDFDVAAISEFDSVIDAAGDAVVLDFDAAAVGKISRRPNETIHTRIRSGRGFTEAA